MCRCQKVIKSVLDFPIHFHFHTAYLHFLILVDNLHRPMLDDLQILFILFLLQFQRLFLHKPPVYGRRILILLFTKIQSVRSRLFTDLFIFRFDHPLRNGIDGIDVILAVIDIELFVVFYRLASEDAVDCLFLVAGFGLIWEIGVVR